MLHIPSYIALNSLYIGSTISDVIARNPLNIPSSMYLPIAAQSWSSNAFFTFLKLSPAISNNSVVQLNASFKPSSIASPSNDQSPSISFITSEIAPPIVPTSIPISAPPAAPIGPPSKPTIAPTRAPPPVPSIEPLSVSVMPSQNSPTIAPPS